MHTKAQISLSSLSKPALLVGPDFTAVRYSVTNNSLSNNNKFLLFTAHYSQGESLYDKCKIRGFIGGNYEECRPLGSGAVWLL
jgi:hypothetical protein